MEPLENKLLERLTTEEKLELATRALFLIAKSQVIMAHRFEDFLDRLEIIVKRLEAGSWQAAINAELDRREKNASS